MAGAVFPENMNKLDVENPQESLKTLENYIGYMKERMEFSMKNTLRTAEASGVTNAAVLMMISALSNTLSALQSTVNQQSGEITGVKNTILTIQESIDNLSESVGANTAQLTAMQSKLTALTERVDALETPGDTGGT